MPKVGRYGKRVIGEKAHKRQAKVKEKAANIYGPRVTGLIDDEAAEAPESPARKIRQEPKREPQPQNPEGTEGAAKKAEEGAEGTAEGTTGEKRPTPPPPPATVPQGDVSDLNVAEIRTALRRNPNLVDAIFEAEMARDEPRKSAIDALVYAESQRDGGARDKVLDRLDAALERVTSTD